MRASRPDAAQTRSSSTIFASGSSPAASNAASVSTSSGHCAPLIPGCRVVELPDVDHYPSIRDPQTVLRLILETADLT